MAHIKGRREEAEGKGGLHRNSDFKSPEGDYLYHVRHSGGLRQHE